MDLYVVENTFTAPNGSGGTRTVTDCECYLNLTDAQLRMNYYENRDSSTSSRIVKFTGLTGSVVGSVS